MASKNSDLNNSKDSSVPNSDIRHIHSSLFKKKSSGFSHENKKKEKLKKIKKSIQLYLVTISMICLIIVVERVIYKFITDSENSVIKALQKSLGIKQTDSDPPSFYRFIAALSDIRYFSMMNTHIYVVIYFGIDAFLCTKIMLMHYLGLFLCYFLQILYKNPRPFWVDREIVSYSCDGDFVLPNDFFFSYIFIFLYIFYNFRRIKTGSENNDESHMKTITELKEDDVSFFHNRRDSISSDETSQNQEEAWLNTIKPKLMLCFKVCVVLVFFVLVFLRYAIGVLYFEAVFMSIVYCSLYYILVIFVDGYLEDFVKRSTIIITESKRYMFRWLIVLILIECLSFILFWSSSDYSDIDWIQHYLNCSYKSDIEVIEIGSKALGYWFSFISTTILFALIGLIFGVPKCYRMMNNVYWYETSLKKKVIRVILASALLIPSWIFFIYFTSIMEGVSTTTLFINEYLAHAVHFFLLYYLLFGLSPYYIFSKLKLTNNQATYTVLEGA